MSIDRLRLVGDRIELVQGVKLKNFDFKLKNSRCDRMERDRNLELSDYEIRFLLSLLTPEQEIARTKYIFMFLR